VALFLSTFVNKVDRKGRVSVPAPFRAALAGQNFAGIIVYPGINFSAIEASGIDRAEELSRRIEILPEFSDEREAISAIFADMHELPFDGEGRIMLPPELCEHAQIVLEGSATAAPFRSGSRRVSSVISRSGAAAPAASHCRRAAMAARDDRGTYPRPPRGGDRRARPARRRALSRRHLRLRRL
jgi:DNA-binding transcriptional regulator/RsmH inhibitor MraZ